MTAFIFELNIMKNSYKITMDLGEVTYIIDASTKEKAIEKAEQQAWASIRKKATVFRKPKLSFVDGVSYKEPPSVLIIPELTA